MKQNSFYMKWIAGSVIMVIFAYSLYYNYTLLSPSSIHPNWLLAIIVTTQSTLIYISVILGKKVRKMSIKHGFSETNTIFDYSMMVVIFSFFAIVIFSILIIIRAFLV